MLSCKRIEYTFASSFDKFQLKEFSNEIARRTGEPFDGESTIWFVAPTRNPKTVGYHVHFSYRRERHRRFNMSLEYMDGSETPDTHETRPFAEELMGWIGQFFRSERVAADVEGTFLYSLKKFEPVLPMPTRLALGRKQKVEVVGMSLLVSAKPQGVYSAFVASDDDEISVDAFAERIVKLKEFDLRSDLLPLSSMARLFVREITK